MGIFSERAFYPKYFFITDKSRKAENIKILTQKLVTKTKNVDKKDFELETRQVDNENSYLESSKNWKLNIQ